MSAILCSPRIYEYDGVMFEMSTRNGPHPLKKNGDPMQTISRSFWDMYDRFSALSKEEQEAYRIGGGCMEV